MTKAVIFDCFGVIYPNTHGLLERKYPTKDDKRRAEIADLQKRVDMGYMSRDAFLDQLATALGVKRQEIDEFLARPYTVDTELLEYIKMLKPKVKTAMLTNVGKGSLEKIFTQSMPMSDYFDEVFVSSEMHLIKPHPEAYRYAAEKLNVKEVDCVFIDDSTVNVQGAEGVGMRGIVYTDFKSMKSRLKELL